MKTRKQWTATLSKERHKELELVRDFIDSLPPGTRQEHDKMQEALYKYFGFTVEEVPLDPNDPFDQMVLRNELNSN